MLEYKAGNIGLARSMHSCAVKADPESDFAWEVSNLYLPRDPLASQLLLLLRRGFREYFIEHGEKLQAMSIAPST